MKNNIIHGEQKIYLRPKSWDIASNSIADYITNL